MEQKEKLCDEVETVNEFAYLGVGVRAVEGCEASMTARRRCSWLILVSVVSCCTAQDSL